MVYLSKKKTHYIYSGQPISNPILPKDDDILFLRKYRTHMKKEDSYITGYEYLSDNESNNNT